MISWIKLDINILDDAKIKIIRSHPDGNSIVVLWIGLLCLAMKSSRPGIIEISDGMPYTVDDLSNLFNIEKKTVELGLALFAKYKMVDLFDGNTLEIINFSKHQKLEEIERRRELTRVRTVRYRERLRICDASQSHGDDNRQDKDKTKTKIKNRGIFQIPTLQEVSEYCIERKNKINAQQFIDHYESKGWFIGKNKMKDWKAAVRTWEAREDASTNQRVTTGPYRKNNNDRPSSLDADTNAELDRLAAKFYENKAAVHNSD